MEESNEDGKERETARKKARAAGGDAIRLDPAEDGRMGSLRPVVRLTPLLPRSLAAFRRTL